MDFKRAKNNLSNCKAILGPTNTGKTYYAIERMISYKNGVIGVPLRLLAREIYDKLILLKGSDNVVLNTGEEKIRGKHQRYWVCTTEAMPVGLDFEFVAVDEIQLCADAERGHVFTDRLLNVRGKFETLFLGSSVMLDLIKIICPEVQVIKRDRLSKLSYSGRKNISKLAPRTAIVDFSVDRVYEMAEHVRTSRGGAAVVLGALSPKTRNAQIELYQNGDVDHVVATDAIGLGLNLRINNVYFAALQKFDGRRLRALTSLEVAQIAGRAGRYTTDGYFGETGNLKKMGDIIINAVEDNIFPMLRRIKWRNSDLDFNNIDSLIASLDLSSSYEYLERAQDSSDINILKFITSNDPSLFSRLKSDDVKLLWNVCQIPDFRKISHQDHADLIIRLFKFIQKKSFIPHDWLKVEIDRLDNVQGDIDILSKRLSFIRTWSFVSNINNWVVDNEYFVEVTRNIEDKLSDALHLKLTQRFVDLRRSVLIKKRMMESFDIKDFELRDDYQFYVKGHLFGRMKGFIFTLLGGETLEENKKLMQLVRPFLRQQLKELVKKFYDAPESEFVLDTNGDLLWRENKVAKLVKSQNIFSPKINLIKIDELDKNSLQKIQRKLDIFVSNKVEKLLPNLLHLSKSNEYKGPASGIVHTFIARMGIVLKTDIIEQYKNIDNQSKDSLKGSGIRFGYKTIYDPSLLKPDVTRLRTCLFNIFYGLSTIRAINPPPGLVTIKYDKEFSKQQYLAAGFFVAGSRAIRVDMLERLYFLFRDHPKGQWIVINPLMLSITGLGLDNFIELIRSLRFEIKYEKIARDEEIITFEKDDAHFKVQFRKILINKKEKKTRSLKKNSRHNNNNNKSQKNKVATVESPFSELKNFFKN